MRVTFGFWKDHSGSLVEGGQEEETLEPTALIPGKLWGLNNGGDSEVQGEDILAALMSMGGNPTEAECRSVDTSVWRHGLPQSSLWG